MRKILKLVLGLLLVGSMVFGANPSESFVITTTIPAMAELKIHTASVNTISDFNSVTTATGHTFTITGYGTADAPTTETATFYTLIKTNAKTDTYIKASFSKMTGTPSSGNTLDYTLNYGASSKKASENNGAALPIFTISGGNGARVVSNSFSIDILTEDIKTAAPDFYSATITFEYTTTN